MIKKKIVYFMTSIILITIALMFGFIVNISPNNLEFNGIEYDVKLPSVDYLIDNIYKYSEYVVDEESGECYGLLLKTEEPIVYDDLNSDERLDKLLEIVENTEYTYDSSDYLKDGVNCQYMAVYIEKYCSMNNLSCNVIINGTHVFTEVNSNNRKAVIDFNSNTYIKISDI